jgi:hypothetical protein
VEGGRAIRAEVARIRVGNIDQKQTIDAGARSVLFDVMLGAGSQRLETWFEAGDKESRGAYYVTIDAQQDTNRNK